LDVLAEIQHFIKLILNISIDILYDLFFQIIENKIENMSFDVI